MTRKRKEPNLNQLIRTVTSKYHGNRKLLIERLPGNGHTYEIQLVGKRQTWKATGTLKWCLTQAVEYLEENDD